MPYLSIYLPIYTKQSPFWEANNASASREFSYILWKQKVQYRVHKSHLLVPILSQINPVHNLILLMKEHFNIILQTTNKH